MPCKTHEMRRILYPTWSIFRFGARLASRWQPCMRQYGKWAQRRWDGIDFLSDVWEMRVSDGLFLLFVFSILVYLASEAAALGRTYFNKRFRSVALKKHCARARRTPCKKRGVECVSMFTPCNDLAVLYSALCASDRSSIFTLFPNNVHGFLFIIPLLNFLDQLDNIFYAKPTHSWHNPDNSGQWRAEVLPPDRQFDD